jgi:hypothetical protein
MTAIQQMIDFINDINDNDRSEFNYYYDHIIEKLNELLELEKQQIVDAVLFGMQKGLNVNNVPETDNDWVNNYYNKTCGSKVGGALKFSQTDENGKPLTYWGGLDKKPQTLTSLWGLMKDRTCTNSCSVVCGECQIPASLQTEISDEEIEKQVYQFKLDYENVGVTEFEVSAFIMGMKKYKEQLKSKQ